MYVYYIKNCYMKYTLCNVSGRTQLVLYTHIISMWQCALPLPSLARDGHLFFIKPKKSHLSLSLILLASQQYRHYHPQPTKRSLIPLSLVLLAQQYHHYHPQPTKKSLISLSLVLLAQQYHHYHPQQTKRVSSLSLSRPIGTAILSLSSTTDNLQCSIAALPSCGIHPEGPC